MDSTIYLVFAAIAFLIVFAWVKNRPPCLTGMSIDEAKHFLSEKYPKYKLRNKVGFIEPDTGKAFMLGKIAKIDLDKSSKDEIMVDYTLYQIDTSKISHYSNEMVKKITANPNASKEFKQFNDLQSALQDLAELSTPEQSAPVKHHLPVQPRPSIQKPIVQEQPTPTENEEFYNEPDMSIFTPSRQIQVQPPRGLVNEVSLTAPKTSNNRLKMSIPDRASNSRSHFSRESFFW
jgi:hypothetical protein